MEDLKLYVWEDVLPDYSYGAMFALAHDEEEARRILLEKDAFIPEKELNRKPDVYTYPVALTIWGGA